MVDIFLILLWILVGLLVLHALLTPYRRKKQHERYLRHELQHRQQQPPP